MNWTKIIKQYNEWLTIPIALVLFFVAPGLYRLIDPTAGAFDAGVFHVNFYAIATLFLYSGVSWFLLKLKFPVLKKFLDDDAEDLLSAGDPRHKWGVILAFAIYLSFIFCLILISNQS
ncbi:hypothetical protein [Reichenbachiella sp.]|uniref:hypothetical protein n=1 Tax=Reichenbachiella sp. TaxID=2184521 RepID=UPI003B5B2CEE